MANGKSVRESVEASVNAHENDEVFERSLGRLMIAWADTEAEMRRVLIAYSGVSDAVARAIFSGVHASTMVTFIRNIAHNTNMAKDRRDDLEHVFPQLTAINTMRDLLVHHATSSHNFKDEKTRIVANLRSNRYGSNKGHEISAETIDAMTWDLYGIANHLNMHWGPRVRPFVAWRENPENGDAPTPWTYISPPPIDKWEQSPSDCLDNPHQPQPSVK